MRTGSFIGIKFSLDLADLQLQVICGFFYILCLEYEACFKLLYHNDNNILLATDQTITNVQV